MTMLFQTWHASIYWIWESNEYCWTICRLFRCISMPKFKDAHDDGYLLYAAVTQLNWRGLKHGPPLTVVPCLIIYETFNTITADGLTFRFNLHRILQLNCNPYSDRWWSNCVHSVLWPGPIPNVELFLDFVQKNMVEYNHIEVIKRIKDSFIFHKIKQLIVHS